MPMPVEDSQPHLAAGCRWGGTEDNKMLLFPEGAMRIEGTGRSILERCDGQRTLRQIVGELQVLYNAPDPARIRDDVAHFLEQLQEKRVVDY